MLQPFLSSDIAPFLALATSEGWICGNWEFEFLLSSFPQGCLVKRDGAAAEGFITSVRHDKSGWIGNLLVAPDARRRGVGTELMQGALHALLDAGVETIWLTASAKGVELYRKLGFVAIDSINRWVGEGGSLTSKPTSGQWDPEMVRQVDSAGWGDRREALLRATSGRGSVICGDHSFLCMQRWGQGTQLGPWGSLFDGQAASLFQSALAAAEQQVFLDVPAGNVMAASLLTREGFTIRDNNTLMYLGTRPDYDARKVFALASMGSMG